MSAEIPGVDSGLEHEGSSWEYCVLSWPRELNINNDTALGDFVVNSRHGVVPSDEIEREMREIKKTKKKPDVELLNTYYKEKFSKRALETGGFGLFDAIDILAQDNWELVTSARGEGHFGEIEHLIFKRPKGPEPSDQASE